MRLFATKRLSTGHVLDDLQVFLEAFLFTRILLCLSPWMTLVDVLTDIIAAIEFAKPSDGSATQT